MAGARLVKRSVESLDGQERTVGAPGDDRAHRRGVPVAGRPQRVHGVVRRGFLDREEQPTRGLRVEDQLQCGDLPVALGLREVAPCSSALLASGL